MDLCLGSDTRRRSGLKPKPSSLKPALWQPRWDRTQYGEITGMPKHAPADVNAVSAPTPPGSVDETLKAKTPKKPKGWKKWKRRLSRVFKGKKKTKEPASSGQKHAKAAQYPERVGDQTVHKQGLDQEPLEGDEEEVDDDGTDESPAVSEKEIDPRSRESHERRRSGRSDESSYSSDRGEDWENDGAVEHEPEDDGEEYEEEEDGAGSDVLGAAESHEVQFVEENHGDDVIDDEEVIQSEDEDQQHASVVQEPQTDDYEEQDLRQEVGVEGEEYEDEYDEAHDVSAEIEDSAADECVDQASPLCSRDEHDDIEADAQHQTLEDEDDEEDEDVEAAYDEQGEEEVLDRDPNASIQLEVGEETVNASSPNLHVDESEHLEAEDLEADDDHDAGPEDDATDDTEESYEEQQAAMDLHLEFSDDVDGGDHDEVAVVGIGSAGLASVDNWDADDDCSQRDTHDVPPPPVAVSTVEVHTPALVLSEKQQHALATIVSSIPSDLPLVHDMSAWCVLHSATEAAASPECQLFLLSVKSGKWKLAQLLAEKLHRDHVRPAGLPLQDQFISAILAQSAA